MLDARLGHEETYNRDHRQHRRKRQRADLLALYEEVVVAKDAYPAQSEDDVCIAELLLSFAVLELQYGHKCQCRYYSAQGWHGKGVNAVSRSGEGKHPRKYHEEYHQQEIDGLFTLPHSRTV